MGAVIGVTGVQLRRIFAEGAGASPCRFLIDLRLQAAADLLADPCLRVKEILDRVGIADGSHFCREFRDRFGVSATEYRARRLYADSGERFRQ